MKFFLLLVVLVFRIAGAAESGSMITLHLLNMLPNSGSASGPSNVPGRQRGFEILPAAHIAVDEINRLPNLLPHYCLELIDVVTEGCNAELALIEAVKHLTDERKMIIGIVGLFCDEITQIISPLATSFHGHGFLQLSGSASPIFRDTSMYPYLYRMLPSSAVYTETVICLMEQLEWSKIGILYAAIDNTFYFRTAQTFAQNQNTSSKNIMEVSFYGEVTPREFPDFSILQSLQHSGTKVTLLLLPIFEASKLLCSAYTQGFRWPYYAWLLLGEDTQDQFVSPDCGAELMKKAMEGVFVLHYRFQPNSQNSKLISGKTYNEYLQKLQKLSGMNHSNSYANVLYDSVWTFAVALNNSEDVYRGSGGDIHHIREAVKRQLPKVSFTGALGDIRFDLDQEVKITVDILQIKSGTSIPIGYYDPVHKHLNLNRESIGKIPSDELERTYQLFPISLTVVLSATLTICILFTTAMLLLFICYRNQPEIKASSWFLSLFIFLGCYLIYIGTLAHVIASGLVIDGSDGRKVYCAIIAGINNIAIDIIFATLFTKMLRIYRVFTYFGKTGKAWSDSVLIIFIILVVLGKCTVFVIWAVVDLHYLKDIETYKPNTIPPHYEVVQHCASERTGIWLTIMFGYSTILYLSLLLLAFKTRKIRRENYKDTKKVNAFLLSITIDLCLSAPLWWVLQTVGNPTESKAVLAIGYGLAATACQFYLIAPKTIPPFSRHLRLKCCHMIGSI